MARGVILTKNKQGEAQPEAGQSKREVADAGPPGDIYESVVRDLGFDPLREMAARRA